VTFQNETRRSSIAGISLLKSQLTFQQLEEHVKSLFFPPDYAESTNTNGYAAASLKSQTYMAWQDNEGHMITLKNQSDLDEYINFLKQQQLAEPITLKLTLVSKATTTNPFHFQRQDSFASSVTSKSSVFDNHGNNGSNNIGHVGSQISPKTLRNLEKVNRKCAKKNSKCAAKLEKLKSKEGFDEKEYLRLQDVLQGLDIPINPFFEMKIAKKIIKDYRCRNCWLTRNCANRSLCNRGCHDNRYSEKTQRQLQVLRENGLPAHWCVGKLLEIHNKGQEQAHLALTAGQNSLLARQLQEVAYLEDIPLSTKVTILNFDGAGCCWTKCC